MDPLDRETFGAIVRDLEYPAARCGTIAIAAGEESWRELLPGMGRPERRAALASLHDALLCATPGSRARWEASRRQAGMVPLMTRAEHEAFISDRLVCLGDRSLVPIIIEGLRTCPEPVQDAALREAAWLAVGLDSVAWTVSSAFVDKEGRPRLRVVNLGPAADVRVVRHEAAHVWLHDVGAAMEARPAVTAQGEIALLALAERDGWLAPLEAAYWCEERRCDALAQLWSGDV